MNELQICNDTQTISSREVAEMIEVTEHSKMLRKIDGINEILTKTNLASSDYWIESQYKAGNGEMRREYQVTKKGCELIAHKTEGEKGVIFTVRYMERFDEMEKYVQDSYMIADPIERAKRWIEEQREKEEIKQLTVIQQQQITELQPKATYYDLILQCADLLSITKIAKDYGKSGQWLNKLLVEEKIQFKQGDIYLLYQKYAEKGYTSTKTQNFVDDKGNTRAKVHTYWTQKGRIFIYELLKSKGFLPNIER